MLIGKRLTGLLGVTAAGVIMMTQPACPPRTRVTYHPIPRESALARRERLTAGRAVDSAARIYHTHASGFEDPIRLVIRDPATWVAIWLRIRLPGAPGERGVAPPAEPPAIDFGKEIVVIASFGYGGCGGEDVAIDSVYVDGDNHPVVVVNMWDELSCGCLMEGVQPLDVIRLPRSGPVRFVDRPLRDACGGSPHR